jgi:Protein of unknown function (DUF1569)
MKTLASLDVLSEIRERLRSVRIDDHALWGSMTAKQMVRHLRCSCEVALGERSVEPRQGFAPVLMKFLALRTGVRWPKNVETTPELKRAMKERSSSSEFDVQVCSAIDKIQILATGTQYAAAHPMFGPMSDKDWKRWGYLHADHHLRQFGR